MAEANGYEPRLKKLYRDEIRGRLNEQFKYKNTMETPAIEKVVINMGLGDAVNDRKVIDGALKDLTRIAGQKPVICSSVSTFACAWTVHITTSSDETVTKR